MTGHDPQHEDTHEAELTRVLAPLRDGPIALSDRHEDEALRARIVPRLRERLVSLHTQRARDAVAKRKRVVFLSAAIATTAIAAAAFLMLKPQTPSDFPHAQFPNDQPRTHSGLRIEDIAADGAADREAADWVDANGQQHAIGSGGLGTLLPVGALELRARESSARLRTDNGAEVELAPHTRLAVRTKNTGEEPTLRLLAGEISCAVPHLGPHKQFAIETKSARVVVHGTRFTVREQVTTLAAPRTCVRVQEGLVAVHHGAQTEWLKPGMQWGCDATEGADLEDALTASDAANDAANDARERSGSREDTATRAAAHLRAKAERERAERARGTLVAENRLLAQALRAERKQDKARAHALFGTLLRRHPDSPLATDAAAGLERTR